MKSALTLLFLALAAAAAFSASPAYAQVEVTEADPPDGARLDAPPDIIHLCFSQPAIVEDNTTFAFGYEMPNGRRLGLRIVWQPDGECADVHRGLADEYPAGEHFLEWHVTAREGGEEGSGTVRFEVTKGSTPAPSATPAVTPSDVTPSPAGGTEPGDADDNDGPDILFLALITIASVGGAAVLFTLGYFLRRRIGYEPHRPPEGGEGDEGH
jgi:methionine-rich copper-binding protein CopC